MEFHRIEETLQAQVQAVPELSNEIRGVPRQSSLWLHTCFTTVFEANIILTKNLEK